MSVKKGGILHVYLKNYLLTYGASLLIIEK